MGAVVTPRVRRLFKPSYTTSGYISDIEVEEWSDEDEAEWWETAKDSSELVVLVDGRVRQICEVLDEWDVLPEGDGVTEGDGAPEGMGPGEDEDGRW